MLQTKEDFSKFGKSFQESLCHLILEDRPFADQIFEVLDLKFLELKHLRVFVGKVKEYREKYDRRKKIITKKAQSGKTSNILRRLVRGRRITATSDLGWKTCRYGGEKWLGNEGWKTCSFSGQRYKR